MTLPMDETELAQRIEKHLKKSFSHGMWAGMLFGLLLGGLIGYSIADYSIQRTHVITWEEGQEI